MKIITAKKLIALVIVVVLSTSIIQTAVQAYQETFTSGKDWVEKMSRREKFISIFAPMILFQRYGVPFQKTPEEYIVTINKVLMYNPYLEREDVVNIFASALYEYEPESRPAIRSMAREFRYRYSGNEFILPRLSLQPSAQPSDE